MAPRPLTTTPVLKVLVAIASVQVGAAFAKDLFDEVTPVQMVWLRLATSAVVFMAIARPQIHRHSRADWGVVVAFAVSLGGMNWAIYESFARIPLGLAVTIEFVGPLGLAVFGSRRVRDLVWVALAGAGVVLLGWQGGALDPLGIGFAVLAGLCWSAYIVCSARTGRRWPGVDGLALASVLAAAVITVPAFTHRADNLAQPHVLVVGALVGLLSSVIPYSLEISALRSIRPATFGILMSLEPAAAAVAGMVVLAEFLSGLQWLAMACVVIASVGATRAAAPAAVAPAPHE